MSPMMYVVRPGNFPNAIHYPREGKIDDGLTLCGVKIAYSWHLTPEEVTCKNCLRVIDSWEDAPFV